MIDYERGLYVHIVQRQAGPPPLPLVQGFSEQVAYRILGVYNPSETGECWLILSNDRDELWYISQRHVRTWELYPELAQLRLAIATNTTPFASIPTRKLGAAS